MITQFVDAAHLDGLDGDDLVLGGEFLEDVVEETFIVEVLGNLDAQFLFVAVVAEGCAEEDQPYDADDCRREYREGDVAAAAGKADRHREHDREDLTGRTRLGAEAYQREYAEYRDARACCQTVDHHDQHGDDGGNDGERDREALGAIAFEAVNKG